MTSRAVGSFCDHSRRDDVTKRLCGTVFADQDTRPNDQIKRILFFNVKSVHQGIHYLFVFLTTLDQKCSDFVSATNLLDH